MARKAACYRAQAAKGAFIVRERISVCPGRKHFDLLDSQPTARARSQRYSFEFDHFKIMHLKQSSKRNEDIVFAGHHPSRRASTPTKMF